MKLLIISMLFIFTVADASYVRSIRLQSFSTKNDALKAKKIFSKYATSDKTLSNLQENFNFDYKIIKVGKYYMLSIEPVTNKDAVQDILQIVHKKFPDAYPRKIKPLKHTNQKIIKKIPPPSKEKIEKITLEEVTEIVEKPKEDKKIQKNESIQIVNKTLDNYEIDDTKKTSNTINKKIKKQEPEPEQKHTKEQKQKSKKDIPYGQISLYLLGGFFLLILILIRFLFKIKKEKDTYIHKDLINTEKLNHLKHELQNKDKVLSNATHELRTPMTAIMGLTHIVLESELPKQQKEYIQKIENSAENMLRIINDILDISKIQAGKLKIEKAEFNINDILEYVLNTISIKAKNNHISILMNIDNDVPSHLVGDSFRLGQVLINLLSNSVKFTKDGEVSLKVKKISNHGDNIKLNFIVSDTGIGMSESQLQNLFQSYHQAEVSTTREYGGTGLGLSISKHLVEMMGGNIKVTSQKDVGTTFTFSVNFKLKDSQNKRQYRLPSASLLNKSILIVDESSRNVISLIGYLGYFNYKTHTIPSFEKAILKYDIKPDIIIINQANLTNIAVKKIKDLQKQHNSKVVVLSEFYSVISNKSLQGLKIDAYLKTPFTQQNILNMITELYVSKNLDNRSRKKKIKEKLKELNGKKILIAEDNELNHKVISGLLSHTDIELTFVKNGREAIELLNSGIRFDMILMDINMPILGGYEATEQIRQNQKYNQIPIIALSADVTDVAIKKAISSGMQGHISKPIMVDTFYKKIFDTLKRPLKHKENQAIDKKQRATSEFEELSISIGIDRCDNDENFYKLILQDFKKMYANSAQELKKLCKDMKFKEARHMAMDIKDVALNIGAYNLCESAATMEYEFEKASRSNWQELIRLYHQNITKLFQDIDRYLDR
jgi:signal transduction histidine kinase/DNA-binding response OmpR family regulator